MKKRMRITVNGNTYEVEAEILDDHQSSSPASSSPVRSATSVAAPTAVQEPQAKVLSNTTTATGVVPSPIAGTVVSIAKSKGSEVTEGEVLLVMEAMKMNTEVTAPCSGSVTEVNVNQGDSVEEGQALLTIG